MHGKNPNLRLAIAQDYDSVVELMIEALQPYYGGDHRAHADRIFGAHLQGGTDSVGQFSSEQRMLVAEVDGHVVGLVHLVTKKQGTLKISPIIVDRSHRGLAGIGSTLLSAAEAYAVERKARQLYCTVAEQNLSALQFFTRKGFVVAGRSGSHYKPGITEVMLYKAPAESRFDREFDRPNISVSPMETGHEVQVRELLLSALPRHFRGIDPTWVDSLLAAYGRRDSRDVNLKFKLIFVALDRVGTVLGVMGCTPKKGEPIKLMPFVAGTLPAFLALLTDVPFLIRPYGRKLYMHVVPSVDEIVTLQQREWRLDAVLPAAYREDVATQQWSLDITGEDFMRQLRVKQPYLALIREGRKTLEVRVAYDSINSIQQGERIRVSSRIDSLTIRVRNVRRYSSFAEMSRFEPLDRIVPGVDKSSALSILREIYPPDRERLGVVVLEIQPEGTGAVDASSSKAQGVVLAF